MNILEKRCADLSYRHRLTHVSSVLNTVNLLEAIYKERRPHDPVVLGNSHAALALYVVLEAAGLCDAEDMIRRHGTHAARDMEHGVWVSGGSLGQAETIAVGMALADRDRDVWLVTSDGACAEGCIWEAFHLAASLNLTNLQVFVVANGLGGYRIIDIERLGLQLELALSPILVTLNRPAVRFPWLASLDGHYLTLTEAQWQELIK
jgi:transketolase N-terminal domain/subunit